VDRPPRRLTAPPPGYPEDARRAGLEGHVVFEMAIGTNGIPVPESFVVIEADDSLFVAAAREAALGSRYEPAMAGGHPVCVMVRQPIDFVLPRQR
jgi:protein TonB